MLNLSDTNITKGCTKRCSFLSSANCQRLLEGQAQKKIDSPNITYPRFYCAEEGGQYRTFSFQHVAGGWETVLDRNQHRTCNTVCFDFIFSHRHPLLDAIGEQKRVLSHNGHSCSSYDGQLPSASVLFEESLMQFLK